MLRLLLLTCFCQAAHGQEELPAEEETAAEAPAAEEIAADEPTPEEAALEEAVVEDGPAEEPAAEQVAPGEPPADPAQAPPPEEELPPLVKEPQLLDFVEAPYPAEARQQGVEGTVLLALEIDETGAVVSAEVLEPVGHGFDEAALEAVVQFRFSPAEDEQGPVPVIIEFAYGFVGDIAAHEGAHADVQADEQAAEEIQAELPVNLEGQLTEMGTKRTLRDFPVLLPELELSTSSDDQGWFRFHGVPPGSHALRVAQPGFDPIERQVEVVADEVTTVKLWLRNKSYRQDELVGVYQRQKEEVTRRTLSVEQVRRVPGTFGDPVRVIQSLPGAARSPFSTGLLVIRGANPEDSGVYVDGIRIPLIYHLDGILSVINSDLIESVDYLPGGYGVRYGRSMGGAIDVNTKHSFPEESHKFSWTTDILHSGGLLTGRLGKEKRWGYAVGGRRSYIDLFIPLFTKDSGYTIKPRWFDYQLKLDRLDLNAGRFSIFLFGFQDLLEVATPSDVAQGTDQDTQGDMSMLYSTHRLIVDWERSLGETLSFRVTPSFGVDLGSGNMGDSFDGSETQWLVELRAELPWEPSEHLTITPGTDFIAGPWQFDVSLPFDPSIMADYDPIGEREDWAIQDHGWVWAPDSFIEADIRPLRDPEKLLITPGLRMNYSWLTGGFKGLAWDPRLAVILKPHDSSTLKASTGIYHQPPMPTELYRPDGNVELDYEYAISTTLGWEQFFTPAFNADIEFFYKWLDSLIVFANELDSMDDPYYFNEGVGRVYGMEVMLRREAVDRFFGWISYTLSKSERADYPEESGQWDPQWYPFQLDQTHILVAVGGLQLPYDFEISTRIQFVTGNPYTPYAGGIYDIDQGFYWAYSTADYNSQRLPNYFAVDLRISKLYTFRRWQLSSYFDLLNVVRATNPEFVIYNYDYTEEAYVRGLPFIPNPGVDIEIYF